MSKIHFVKKSSNIKTGDIPVTYSARETCPPSCAHYQGTCYGEDYFTRMVWDKVPARGGDVKALAASVAALPAGTLWRHNVVGDLPGLAEKIDGRALGQIIKANKGRRGFTFTHKTRTARNRALIQLANNAGFTINLSADDVGHADALAAYQVGPVVALVPMDTPAKFATPDGRAGVVCPAQLREEVTCKTCGLCSLASRRVIVGFRAHGSKAKAANVRARKVIPIIQIKVAANA